MTYAVVMGEGLVDLLETEVDGEQLYRPAPGGSPYNVAVGVARLGGAVEFVGSFGDDVLAHRLRAFLTDRGVGLGGSITTDTPTSIAMTSFEGAEPDFTFYGSPHSFGLLGPEQLDRGLVAGAAVVHAGSISLLEAPVYEAARAAFAVAGPYRTLDPNVRPSVIGDVGGFRAAMAALYAQVDLVKLSAADAAVLYGGQPLDAARRIAESGPAVVVVTRSEHGALLLAGDDVVEVPGRPVEAVDATGAGDSFMGALIAEILRAGPPDSPAGWRAVLRFAVDVAAVVVTAPGGASAMPTRERVAALPALDA